MKIKERKKKFIRKSKNGTVFYLDKYGSNWCHCDPFKILYIKHNQYLFDRDGFVLKISQLNEKGFEVSAYLFEDIKKNGYVDKYNLEQEVKDTYLQMFNN